ncbi:TPA: hypothetical protein MKV14_003205 [Morganella morganii]|nr:hypothetical protein [Morganella morganii]
MEFKGTPGPWKFMDGFVFDKEHSAVAEIYGFESDGKVMAAAPDLLEALIELRKLVTHHDQADAAINKALGRE